MEISIKADWITATRKFTDTERLVDSSLREVAPLVLKELNEVLLDHVVEIERVHQQRFYDFAFKCKKTGVVVNVALKGNNRGIMLVFSGQALSRRFDTSLLLQSLFAKNYKVTRLDVAFDVLNSAYSTVDIADTYEREVGERGKDTYAFISSPTGSTLYIGARKSDCMVRVYDKGKESNTDLDWIRFEIEFKRSLADQISIQIYDDLRASGIWLQKKLSIQDHPVLAAIDEFCRNSHVPNVKLPVPQSDRIAWLLSVVLPAFDNAFDSEPINASMAWESFSQKLHARYKSVTGGEID